MLRRIRLRRSFWSAVALGILAVPTLFSASAAAPAQSQEPLQQPELNPLAELPPDPADLLAELLDASRRQIDDLVPDAYQLLVARAAHRHRLDPRLVAAVVLVESQWNPAAVGSHGERGLMQILPATGAWLARRAGMEEYDLDDPETNLALGASYLSLLLREHGTAEKALAAYNGGPRAVDGWQANPYVHKVMEIYNRPRPAAAPRLRRHIAA